MRLLRHDDPGFAAALRPRNRRATSVPHVNAAVSAITAEVRPTGTSLRAAAADSHVAARVIDARTQHAMVEAHKNIRAFTLK